ncbi:hypothetical protein [Alicyclobacillus fastidiosus]|uniref:Uncharacterized protein n=1 Tax=Alicyclobacillus fastidiosus TaxID=392011 RepID=A0ABV5AIS2_9BACL|nr:hypothetical protein [Alicyclobacillus fastidiosus]WEH07809.1 hypothetical protein PYS47_13640 [Alicyclobacillus fastidiosus]
MRTLSGYEALEIADQFGISLYDRYYEKEITLEEARQFVESKRDPESFVVNHWPDNDEEAERVVLANALKRLKEQRVSAGRIDELAHLEGNEIHPFAAELAAERLAEQNRIQIVDTFADSLSYSIPQSVQISDEFLDHLAGLVCEECAHMSFEQPFHEACLASLIDFIRSESFTVSDIAETRTVKNQNGKLTKMFRPNFGLLTKKVSETRSRWQSVFKPILSRDHNEAPSEPPQADEPSEPPVQELEATRVSARATYHPEPEVSLKQRPVVSKDELIEYLRSIEIIDDEGHITQLHQERKALESQLLARDEEIRRLHKQAEYWQKQCDEIQRDMDTLIEAMQIAKRRTASTSTNTQVVDATYESKP